MVCKMPKLDWTQRESVRASLRRKHVLVLDVASATRWIHSPVCRMAVCLDSEGNAILLHQLKPK